MGITPAQELQRILDRFPDKMGKYRMLKTGHVLRPGIPRLLAPALVLLFEKLKIIVRVRKQVLRNVRLWRTRLLPAGRADR
jgi:hypothetical protein